jgi:hypothetical protein
VFFALLCALTMFSAQNTWADVSTGVASALPFSGEHSPDGGIICQIEGQNRLCNADSDPNMTGVITESPAAMFDTEISRSGYLPVVTSGKAYVLVSTENGAISVGDYLTSSKIHEGVAVKAMKSGFVMGVAMSAYDNPDPTQYGKVLVVLGIKPAILSSKAGDNLIELIKQGMESAFMTPLSALRYVVASILVIGSIGFGFVHFAQIAKKGVEAVGRNPLASKAINLSILMNISLTLSIVLGGLFISYLILVF